jgi:hypothetical protein
MANPLPPDDARAPLARMDAMERDLQQARDALRARADADEAAEAQQQAAEQERQRQAQEELDRAAAAQLEVERIREEDQAINPPNRRANPQQPTGINAHRQLQGPNKLPPMFVAQVLRSADDLTRGDNEMLHDLLLKQWFEHHPAGTNPPQEWQSRWFAALQDRHGTDSWMVAGNRSPRAPTETSYSTKEI